MSTGYAKPTNPPNEYKPPITTGELLIKMEDNHRELEKARVRRTARRLAYEGRLILLTKRGIKSAGGQ